MSNHSTSGGSHSGTRSCIIDTVTPRRKALLAALVILVAAVVFVATSPHPWAGRLLCEIRGGEWTNRHRSPQEEIVTSGYSCLGL
jgi:hypothetical protein